jgi:hypothetical protein
MRPLRAAEAHDTGGVVKGYALQTFGGLDLRADPEETNRAVDLLNVDLDRDGRVRSRDGYSKLTAAAGATRYDTVFAVATSAAQPSSVKFPGTGADDATVGTIAWTNPGNITALDASTADATLSFGQTSHYLKATNFGFAIPAGATITGVLVTHLLGSLGSTIVKNSIKLVKGGVISGSEGTTNSSTSFGGATDMWGLSLTSADINAANFGVVYSGFGRYVGSSTLKLDAVTITVYYTTTLVTAVAGAAGARIDVIAADGSVAATAVTATDTQSSYAAFGSPATSAVYIANSGTTIRKLVATTFSTPAGMPKCKFVAVQAPSNRLVAANVNVIPTGAASTASTSLVHFSDALAPETWSANNYVYLTPGDNEDIQGTVTWKNHLYVFKSSRFFDFYGNSVDGTGQPVFNYREISGAGLAAPLAVAAAPSGVFFLDRRGVYFTSGGQPQRVSAPVDPLFQDGDSAVYQAGIINPSAIGQASMAWFADRLYIGLPLGSATTNSHTLVFDPERQQWMLFDIPMGDTSPSAQQPARLLFTYAQGTNDIGQYAQNAYSDDAGVAITSRYRTGFMDLGFPDQEKWLRALNLTGTGTVNVKTAVNDATTLSTSTSVAIGTTTGTGRWSQGTRGRNLSLEISASVPWSLSHLSMDIGGVRPVGVRAA